MTKPPATNPCGTCPYRRDVPSGLWAASEYEKLAAYDAETSEQPQKIFLCHAQNGHVCGGWAGCHDMTQNLALRVAVALRDLDPDTAEAILDYVSPVPLFGSGQEAAEFGMRDIENPGPAANKKIEKLLLKERLRDTGSPVKHPFVDHQ